VQRYLTGKSIAQSRLSLLFNAVAKIPMQFFILFIGAMVFAFHVYVEPPLIFHHAALEKIERSAQFPALQARYDQSFEQRKAAAASGNLDQFRAAQKSLDSARTDARGLAEKATGEKDFNDTNYIFLSFVTKYMPVGVVGLIMAAIFAAAMSTISAEINSLATVSVIDVYQRFARPGQTDRHYLRASQSLTAFWGLYAVATAQYGKNLGSLIEAVNMLEESDELVRGLWQNAALMRGELQRMGFDTGHSQTPIVPLMLGDAALAQAFSRSLFEHGVFAMAIGYPTVPMGKARIRVMNSAAHSQADLEQALDIFARVGRELNILRG
jgi:hypothetical protein